MFGHYLQVETFPLGREEEVHKTQEANDRRLRKLSKLGRLRWYSYLRVTHVPISSSNKLTWFTMLDLNLVELLFGLLTVPNLQ